MDEKHAPTSGHNHNHDHTHTREVVNRLARAIGHLQKVKQMVEDGEDCSQVLVQLAAVISALNSTGRVNPGYIPSMLRSHAAAKRRFCRQPGS